LHRDDGSFIQVANNSDEGFYVEIYNRKTNILNACLKNLTKIEDVANLFFNFVNNQDIAAPDDWVRTKM